MPGLRAGGLGGGSDSCVGLSRSASSPFAPSLLTCGRESCTYTFWNRVAIADCRDMVWPPGPAIGTITSGAAGRWACQCNSSSSPSSRIDTASGRMSSAWRGTSFFWPRVCPTGRPQPWPGRFSAGTCNRAASCAATMTGRGRNRAMSQRQISCAICSTCPVWSPGPQTRSKLTCHLKTKLLRSCVFAYRWRCPCCRHGRDALRSVCPCRTDLAKPEPTSIIGTSVAASFASC